jgi:hypothetical protein
MIDYLETLPANYRNQEMIDRVKANLKKQTDMQSQQQTVAPEQSGQEQEQIQQAMQFMEKLPSEVQEKIISMGEVKSLEFIKKLMSMHEKDYMNTLSEFIKSNQ